MFAKPVILGFRLSFAVSARGRGFKESIHQNVMMNMAGNGANAACPPLCAGHKRGAPGPLNCPPVANPHFPGELSKFSCYIGI
jgi:hypothetical protein